MAIDFKKLEASELEMFLESVKGTKLEEQIKKELERREKLSSYAIQEQFKSSRLPDYNLDYLYKCRQLCMEFDVMTLPYLWRGACFDSAGNRKGDFYTGMFGKDKSSLEKKWLHNLGYLSLLFSDDLLRSDYEGTYNTVNYLINSIYRELERGEGSIDSVDTLFVDMPEKEELVRERLSEVAEYLWDIRNSVPDSRSSIGNHGLTVNRNKIKKKISPQQSALIEAVAFGCSVDELESSNYEGAKRLIYVPGNKFRR